MRSVPARPALPILAFACCVTASSFAAKKAPEPPALPSADVRLAIVADSVRGPWTVVVTNHDQVPVRLVADARRLRLLVREPNGSTYGECELPDDMRGEPERRSIVLQPGDRYEEQIDPWLFCWGKLHDRIVPGASVTALLGWKPDKRLDRLHKPQKAPFVVEPAVVPATVRSDKQIASLTTWLPTPPQDKPAEPPAPAQATPLGVARMEMSVARFEDAGTFRDASVVATVKNTGDRAGVIHLRPDDLELRVVGPYGVRATCSQGSARRAVARDFFQTIAPGKTTSVRVLINEICPRGTLDRPGLYVVNAVLHAKERGTEFGLDAVTGDLSAPQPALVRVRSSVQPFHKDPPRVVGPTRP